MKGERKCLQGLHFPFLDSTQLCAGALIQAAYLSDIYYHTAFPYSKVGACRFPPASQLRAFPCCYKQVQEIKKHGKHGVRVSSNGKSQATRSTGSKV
jgi:hypothetical protein